MGGKSNYSESYKREAVTKARASGNVSQTARELGQTFAIDCSIGDSPGCGKATGQTP